MPRRARAEASGPKTVADECGACSSPRNSTRNGRASDSRGAVRCATGLGCAAPAGAAGCGFDWASTVKVAVPRRPARTYTARACGREKLNAMDVGPFRLRDEMVRMEPFRKAGFTTAEAADQLPSAKLQGPRDSQPPIPKPTPKHNAQGPNQLSTSLGWALAWKLASALAVESPLEVGGWKLEIGGARLLGVHRRLAVIVDGQRRRLVGNDRFELAPELF